jgi:hypothetical protein
MLVARSDMFEGGAHVLDLSTRRILAWIDMADWQTARSRPALALKREARQEHFRSRAGKVPDAAPAAADVNMTPHGMRGL